jgi:hypothetical protein
MHGHWRVLVSYPTGLSARTLIPHFWRAPWLVLTNLLQSASEMGGILPDYSADEPLWRHEVIQSPSTRTGGSAGQL